jgi:hypothetical protein
VVRKSTPVVLIGIGQSGGIVEIGLFDDEAAMLLHQHKNRGKRLHYSVWTPQMNDTVPAVSRLADGIVGTLCQTCANS